MRTSCMITSYALCARVCLYISTVIHTCGARDLSGVQRRVHSRPRNFDSYPAQYCSCARARARFHRRDNDIARSHRRRRNLHARREQISCGNYGACLLPFGLIYRNTSSFLIFFRDTKFVPNRKRNHDAQVAVRNCATSKINVLKSS